MLYRGLHRADSLVHTKVVTLGEELCVCVCVVCVSSITDWRDMTADL